MALFKKINSFIIEQFQIINECPGGCLSNINTRLSVILMFHFYSLKNKKWKYLQNAKYIVFFSHRIENMHTQFQLQHNWVKLLGDPCPVLPQQIIEFSFQRKKNQHLQTLFIIHHKQNIFSKPMIYYWISQGCGIFAHNCHIFVSLLGIVKYPYM